jgi:hypothetical protein
MLNLPDLSKLVAILASLTDRTASMRCLVLFGKAIGRFPD